MTYERKPQYTVTNQRAYQTNDAGLLEKAGL